MSNTRVVVTKYGGPEVIEVIQEPLRFPEEGEVRVQVRTAGVALADIMRREGKYPSSPTPPFTPGYDAVGMVDEVGKGVTEFAKGDSVAVFFNGTGGYAAYVYAKEDELLHVPAHIEAGSMVAVILNYVSAYQILHRLANVSAGEHVLIHGASGGVGTALLELGRLAGLQMYGTASSAKHSVVDRFGAMPIDYRNEDFVEILRREVPAGIDAVFDPIGGHNFARSMKTLSKTGRFVAYGYTSVLQNGTSQDWVDQWSSLAETKTTDDGQPIFLYSITSLKRERLDWFREDAQSVISLLEEGSIRPLISHRISLEDAAKAHVLIPDFDGFVLFQLT